MTAKAPVWLGALVSIVAVLLTLLMDRVSMASQFSALSTRVENVQEQHRMMLNDLKDIQQGLEDQRVLLKEVSDRQDEVRRKLGIVR